MYGRLIFATALLFASALPSEAQTRAGARTAPPIRFQEMDRNNDRVVTRAEWQGSDESFRQNDWNADGILSGEEVRLDANERARGRDDFAYDAPEYGFNDWTPRQFAALDRNRDGRIARKEWRLDRELFSRVDRNGDNFVSRAEFNRMPQQLFSSADVNRDGFIEANEWRGARATFDRRDLNHDGRLTRNEFAGSGSGTESVQIPGNTPVGTSGSHSPAYSAGYGRGVVEARAQAREDRVRNQGYDPEGQRELETADSGYDPRFGPKADYQAGYREGWRRGYPEGWRQP
jgi:Ca2+-binding EF-hand superfamily protein